MAVTTAVRCAAAHPNPSSPRPGLDPGLTLSLIGSAPCMAYVTQYTPPLPSHPLTSLTCETLILTP